jgi:hypothetical protein
VYLRNEELDATSPEAGQAGFSEAALKVSTSISSKGLPEPCRYGCPSPSGFTLP